MREISPITVRRASSKDIKSIVELEKKIELGNPATAEMLYSRLKMFEEGFLVALAKNQVVGYVETVIWKEKKFYTFLEICQFSDHCDLNGDTLYIIFIGVDINYRRIGIASRLISELFRIAKKYKINQVGLVSKGEYINFIKN